MTVLAALNAASDFDKNGYAGAAVAMVFAFGEFEMTIIDAALDSLTLRYRRLLQDGRYYSRSLYQRDRTLRAARQSFRHQAARRLLRKPFLRLRQPNRFRCDRLAILHRMVLFARQPLHHRVLYIS